MLNLSLVRKSLFISIHLSFFFIFSSQAQEEIQKSDSTFLTTTGTISLTASDTGLEHWQAGGESSFALNFFLDRNYKYERGSHLWTTLFETSYGLQRLGKGETYKKTDDIIHIQSLYGYKLKKNWFLSYSLDLKTQWDLGKEVIDEKEVLISSFMTPGYINTGFSLTYKYNFGEKDFFVASVQPLTGAKFTVITNQDIFASSNEGDKLYGVEKGNSIRTEWALVSLNFSIQKTFKKHRLSSNLSLFSPMEYAGNFDVNWNFLFISQINDWLGFNINLNLLYDDDTISKVQFKRVIGAGISIKL